MKVLIATVEIPKYERLIKLSNSVRAKYIIKGETPLLLKYCDPVEYKKSGKKKLKKEYSWGQFKVTKKGKPVTQEMLVGPDGARIISNENVAGKPKFETISANKLHRLTMPDYVRSNIINTLKKQFVPYVEKLDPITTFPIIIELEIQDTFEDELMIGHKKASKQPWDVGNRAMFYNKVFEDVLTGCIDNVPTGAYRERKGKRVEETIRRPTTKVIIPDDHRRYVTGSPGALFTPINNTEDRKLIYRIYHDQRECIKNNPNYV